MQAVPPIPDVMKVAKIGTICEGIAERDMVALYNAAPIKQIKPGDHILGGIERSDLHYLILDGKVEVLSGAETPKGTPVDFSAGQCIGPFAPIAGMRFWVRAAEPATVIELKPGVMACLPDKLQIWIYKNASRPGERFLGQASSPSGNFEERYRKLTGYVRHQAARNAEIIASDFVQGFVKEIPKLPSSTTELSGKLLGSNTSVQDVVESIKRDPALAGTVLKCVNSAKYSFNKKIETFYHACIILGFNNIYQLLMEESVKNVIKASPEGQQIHVHSCLVSSLCYEVASLSKDVHPQSAITVGLLHDLGKSVVVLMKQKHPEVSKFAPLFDTSRLGGDLTRHWGLPDRLCQTIESQDEPEFLPPDAVDAAYRKEVAILHVAHILEGIMTGKPLDPARHAFYGEHTDMLGIPRMEASDLYQTKILPAMMKNKQRLPLEIRHLLPA